MNKKDTILIIGAGLCGSLLALRLGQRGYKVSIMEKRPDLRKVAQDAGRSINLAFSTRGNKAMKLVALEAEVAKLCIPMNGRMLHDRQGNTKLSNYSGREHEHINSISREGLNALLLDKAEALENVSVEFNKKCTHIDFENTTANFYNYKTKEEFSLNADIIIGTDGAGSILRKSYYLGKKFLFSFSQEYLTHGYKELTISPTKKGNYKTYKNALHIWARGDFMLIALPNLDGSFTVTLFLSYAEGEYNFNNLRTPLMGDASHAIVPFYGQGMNASFEDVVEFDAILDAHAGNWETVFTEYQKTRKKDTDAIADLAIDNFHEMKSHVGQVIFQEKRTLEMALEKDFPNDYSSKYSLVTFSENIGYREAMLRGRAQDKAILNMLADGELNIKDHILKESVILYLFQVPVHVEPIIRLLALISLMKWVQNT